MDSEVNTFLKRRSIFYSSPGRGVTSPLRPFTLYYYARQMQTSKTLFFRERQVDGSRLFLLSTENPIFNRQLQVTNRP